jgi:hypothetical protein
MLARTIDAIAERGEGLLLLLGRLAIGALYLPSGFGKLTGINGPGVRGFATYLVAHGVPGPAIAWSGVAAVVEFFASLAVRARTQDTLCGSTADPLHDRGGTHRPSLLDDSRRGAESAAEDPFL